MYLASLAYFQNHSFERKNICKGKARGGVFIGLEDMCFFEEYYENGVYPEVIPNPLDPMTFFFQALLFQKKQVFSSYLQSS
jgi:hypothetical protein